MAHSARPTLPPLHSLHLPRSNTSLPRIHELYDLDDRSRRKPQLKLAPNFHQRHQPHIPPPAPSSRTPSPPAPCLRPPTNTPASTPTMPATPFPACKVRLVPTSFENADAVVLVPPPSAPNVPSQPLLLVGPALARLRCPQRQLAKGARIHPYRIARPSDRRPPSGPSRKNA